MRNSYDRTSRIEKSKSWIWGGILLIIFVIILISRFSSSGDTNEDGASLLVTPLPDSTVYISMNSSSKARINSAEKLYATDKSLSVQVGGARAENSDLSIDLDKTTEITYKSSSQSGNTISLEKGRAWIHTLKGMTKSELKYMNISSSADTILILEQNNISSTAYMIQGSALIETKIGTYTLTAGNQIMIAGSDISNAGTNLASLAGSIVDTINEHPLFTRNGGKNILAQSATGINIENNIPLKSSTGANGDSLNTLNGKFIEITDPIDGTLIKNNNFAVMGNILSPEVKKVTINDITATISPVNETFVLQNITLSSEIINLVYKAYGENDKLLERGVISIYGAKSAIQEGSEKLVPNNFQVSNKDFPITFPTENPYKTTDSLVRVRGSVPANTVSYIMVNDYRLQKYIPGGTDWYYFANTQTETMKEGINLYTIRFYAKDNSLIYTQIFTIVKELKNANVSGENIE
ncbi:hypothetical protein KBD33_00970 [Candidatus Gracilibacteria bacterium]|nr:hypothetical protein [Candidatus Gracilibacteria bacterium]